MSDFLNPVSAEDEVLTFENNAPDTRKSKYVFDNGKYLATCTDVAGGTSKAGEPKVVFTFTLLQGPGVGQSVKTHISQKLVWRMIKVANALGGDYPRDAKKVSLARSKLVGVNCTLVLKKEEFNGKEHMQIDDVLPFDASLEETSALGL